MLPAALLACAVGVSPATMQAIVTVESGGNPIALHVNRWSGPQPHVASIAEAVEQANHFIAAGYSVDLGLGQLNSRNLAAFDMRVEDAFDGCRNLAASGAILSNFYGQAVQHWGEGQRALLAALSGYNTGNFVTGFQNGYVSKYTIGAGLADVVTSPAALHEAVKLKPWIKPWADTVVYERNALEVAIQ